jgi:hypothetical protein
MQLAADSSFLFRASAGKGSADVLKGRVCQAEERVPDAFQERAPWLYDLERITAASPVTLLDIQLPWTGRSPKPFRIALGCPHNANVVQRLQVVEGRWLNGR